MDPTRPVLRDPSLTPELLASQGRSLRALARRLLGDAHEAEDVVQDTWVAYLGHSHAIRGRLSHWLGRVVRNRALQRRRGAARQRGREHDAARRERLEADQEALLAREEAVRAVTASLLELDEPYRVVLLLRYYEDRSPIEIARTLGLPPTTVKSRLERGLERLRARLRTRDGADERWLGGLAALAGLRSGEALTGSISLGVGTGALVMGSKLTLGLVGAALACGAFLFWPDGEEPVSGIATAEAGSETTRAPAPGAALRVADAASAKASEREPVAVAADPTAVEFELPFPAETSFPFRVEVRARDAFDLPLEGAKVLLGLRGRPLNCAGVTGANGVLTVEFQGRRPGIEMILDVRHGSSSLGMRLVDLHTGQDYVADVGLRARTGAQRVALQVRGLQAASGRFLFETNFTFPSGNDMVAADSGRALFVDPAPLAACGRSAQEEGSRLEELDILEARLGELRVGAFHSSQSLSSLQSLELSVSTAPLGYGENLAEDLDTTRAAAVRGTVRDPRGVPVPGALVAWRAENAWNRVNADGGGLFELSDLPTGVRVELRAGGGDLGTDAFEITLGTAERATWDPLLQRGQEVIGRLVDLEGRPLAGRAIELESRGLASLWTDSTVTLDDGRFALPNVPAGRHDLFVLPGPEPCGLPIAIRTGVSAGDDVGAIAVATAEDALGSVALRLNDRAGETVPGALVGLWQAESLRGVLVEGPDEGGRFRRDGLAPGRYDVEARCDFGARSLGSIWIESGQSLDLGEEPFGSPGTLIVRSDTELAGRELDLWSLWDGLTAHVTALGGPNVTLVLRPGDYLLTVRGLTDRRLPISILEGRSSAAALRQTAEGLVLLREDPPPFAETAKACSTCHDG